MEIRKNKNYDSLMEQIDFIYKCAYRYCGNKMDAEDLTQETFYIAYKKLHQLKKKSKLKSWLFVILRNLYLKELNKKKNIRFVDIQNDIENLPDITEKEDLYDISETELQNSLNMLEEKFKTPLMLYYFNEFSYKEISNLLNIPIGTVMSKISRAKVFLRKKMKENQRNQNSNIIILNQKKNYLL